MAGNIAAAILKGLGEAGEGMGDAFKMGAKIGSGEADAGESFGYNGGHTAFQGAVEGYTNGLISKDTAAGAMQEAGGAKELFSGGGDKSISKSIGENKGTFAKMGKMFGKSDERLKEWISSGKSYCWKDDGAGSYTYGASDRSGLKKEIEDSPVLNAFRQLDAVVFRYNSEAQRLRDSGLDGTGSIDDDIHVGVKAQDLEKTDLLRSAVSEGDDGYKEVDVKEMTLANTAAISELTRKLDKVLSVINI